MRVTRCPAWCLVLFTRALFACDEPGSGPADAAPTPGRTGDAGPGSGRDAARMERDSGAPVPAAPLSPPGVADERPLSSVVALTLGASGAAGARPDPGANLSTLIRVRVDLYVRGELGAAEASFPLPATTTDGVRAIAGIEANVVVRWLDPLPGPTEAPAARDAVFGANADYIAYFGEGWDAVAGTPPQWNGSAERGWLWVNHEYISNSPPGLTNAPTGQHATLADWLAYRGAIQMNATSERWTQAELNRYVVAWKRQIGGSWVPVARDASGAFRVDPTRNGTRYDATSQTLALVDGIGLSGPAQSDLDGQPLPRGVVSGIMADCSGGQTPWGTVITAEENVQAFYGDLETCWDSNQALIVDAGCTPGGPLSFTFAASPASQFGQTTDEKGRQARDHYGYLVEIDPGVDPSEYYGRRTPGVGHRKLGALGRARWENATFVVGTDGRLLPNQPIVLYAGNDRRGGRVYRFVSDKVHRPGMSRAEIRNLLASGRVYAGHFTDLDNATGYLLATGGLPSIERRGQGRWVEISFTSRDVPPNAAALGRPTITVGEALQDASYNGLGAFATDDDVRRALFTAANKLGIMELNRPEDVEWNAHGPGGKPRLYIAFTAHGRPVALDQRGVLYDPAQHSMASPKREDWLGTIMALEEARPDTPATSKTFTFWAAYRGRAGTGVFDAANPDNLVLDREGHVFFGTDGNFRTNGHADGLYYLDLDPAHRAAQPGVVNPGYGKAFRIAAVPSDAEATGPAFTPNMRTLFFNVQHPGERVPSAWPPRR